MDKLEKVISGIKKCNNNVPGRCDKCPYRGKDMYDCVGELLHDALELLKQQNGLMLALEQSNASNEYLNNSVSELGKIINILKDEIKRLKDELNQYHKADTFLDAHGWQWKDDGTQHHTEHLKDGEQE